MVKQISLCIILAVTIQLKLHVQSKSIFKDTVDGKFDLSEWVLTAHGFIPVPMLITEPALGDIGGALFPVFITRNEPYTDTVNGKVITEHVKPNIYAIGGAYTANGTWLAGAACLGVIKKWRAQYRIATGYANVNLEFYKELPSGNEFSYEFNIRTMPFTAQLIKQFRKRSGWYAGLNYLFLKTELSRPNAEFHLPDEIKRNVSRLGLLVEFDHRDNIFTPDKGFRWNTLIGVSDGAIGSDYNYQSANSAVFGYVPVLKNLVAGFRAEYQQMWGDAPFYLLPYINMRGIPVARYQGNITTLGETEWRWDFTSRFSAIAFGGAGKAMDEWDDYNNSKWHASGGVGARYLIARKLKLRMGLDLARGPEQWAYYMVFGTTWVR